MPLIYITGIPGSGKSTVRKELQRRGFNALGGIEDNIAAFYDNLTGKRINGYSVSAEERTPEWYASYTWKITRTEIEKLNLLSKSELIFLCAVTVNDTAELWDLFDKSFALYADEETLKKRLLDRTNSDVGKTNHELDEILKRQRSAKQKYKQLGAIIIDATKPIDEVVSDILNKL